MLARRFAIVVLLLALGSTGIASADSADENVTVGFGVSVAVQRAYLLDCCGVEQPIADTADACQLSVASGANGFDVLDAAVAQGCINSYSTVPFDESGNRYHRVGCIDGVCEIMEDRRLLIVHLFWQSPVLELFGAANGSDFVAFYEAFLNSQPG